ncbi:MAG TPA: DUF6036 family nucleotidyltransferase [Vicinamibacterales bacterium]|nr:DUF6036 family nucleotidyltransferase [Vicinamibacterales bacterium]
MRQLTDRARLQAFMRALGQRARERGRVYLAGGASAVLLNWRATTVDIDLELDPALDTLLRDIPALKESLQVNVELASPGQFIPPLPGWRDRSPFITREGLIDFHHYDFYAQALAKIERGHARDENDVAKMVETGLVEPARLLGFFDAIEAELYRYPAIDPASFRRAVARAIPQA